MPVKPPPIAETLPLPPCTSVSTKLSGAAAVSLLKSSASLADPPAPVMLPERLPPAEKANRSPPVLPCRFWNPVKVVAEFTFQRSAALLYGALCDVRRFSVLFPDPRVRLLLPEPGTRLLFPPNGKRVLEGTEETPPPFNETTSSFGLSPPA